MNSTETEHERLIAYLIEHDLSPTVTEHGVFGTRFLDLHFLFNSIDENKYEVDLVRGLIENLGRLVPYKKEKRELLFKTIPLHLLFLILLPFNIYSILYWIVFLGIFGELVIPYYERNRLMKMIPKIKESTGIALEYGEMKSILFESKVSNQTSHTTPASAPR